MNNSGKNLLCRFDFDTRGKSYEEKGVISENAFRELKRLIESSSCFDAETAQNTLNLLKICIGIAVLDGAELEVYGNGTARLTAAELCLSGMFTELLARMCSLAKDIKIKTEAGKCAVLIGI